MSRPAGSILTVMVVAGLLLAAAPPTARAELSCGQVLGHLVDCLAYAQGTGPLTQNCCDGVRDLNNAAKTTEDRQATCRCLKNSAAQAPTLRMGAISGIPNRCGIKIPYPLSPSTDCSRVT